MVFDQQTFKDFILENNVIGFAEERVTLHSGRNSHWYADFRKISSDVFLLDQLSEFVLAFCHERGLNPDCFYGVPEGATKLGLVTQIKWAQFSQNYGKGSHCLPMGRGRPKSHGLPSERYFTGEPIGETIILEDVTSTGSSLIDKCLDVLKLGDTHPKIIRAISLLDRMERTEAGGIITGIPIKDALKTFDIEYESMTNAGEMLPLAVEKYKPSRKIREAIEQEFKDYGVVKIQLA